MAQLCLMVSQASGRECRPSMKPFSTPDVRNMDAQVRPLESIIASCRVYMFANWDQLVDVAIGKITITVCAHRTGYSNIKVHRIRL